MSDCATLVQALLFNVQPKFCLDEHTSLYQKKYETETVEFSTDQAQAGLICWLILNDFDIVYYMFFFNVVCCDLF